MISKCSHGGFGFEAQGDFFSLLSGKEHTVFLYQKLHFEIICLYAGDLFWYLSNVSVSGN